MTDIAVIGGGAGGMFASIIASRNGANVRLIERNDRLGKKLLATGNGRCNFTNINLDIDNFSGENNKFGYSALSQFDVYQTMDFFESLGLTPNIFPNGRVYPLSLQSSSMLDVLLLELEKQDVKINLNSYVKKIEKREKFHIYTDREEFTADKLIIATGGMAMPASGSDGNGYNLVKPYGHSITNLIPGLVQLNLEGDIFKQIKGVKYPGTIKLISDGVVLMVEEGDVLFTDYGISGPPILEVSSLALKEYNKNKDVKIDVALIDSMDEDSLIDYLISRFSNMPERNISEGLIGMINKRLILPVLEEVNINKDKKIGNISKQEIISLAKKLVSWKFNIIGSQGWKHAQTTSGGVDTKDINNQTMESKLVEGLYFVGEIIDMEGDCGGFNLQWAWSSAYVAGLNSSY